MPFFFAAAALALVSVSDLTAARDRQDLDYLDHQIAALASADQAKSDVLYRLATAYSYAAEVAMEERQKAKSEQYAEGGYPVAEKLVDWNKSNAEDHRLLGELCGQVIPANPFVGTMKYGPCAKAEIDKAIELDPKLALAYVSRGVGVFYLPASFGGGLEPALKDLDMAISLDPKLADAYVWKGVVLAKAKRVPEARKALETALTLDPDRVWAKQQIDKLPPQ